MTAIGIQAKRTPAAAKSASQNQGEKPRAAKRGRRKKVVVAEEDDSELDEQADETEIKSDDSDADEVVGRGKCAKCATHKPRLTVSVDFFLNFTVVQLANHKMKFN